jgi:leucyl aminopeptidase (aminopeptidase T)
MKSIDAALAQAARNVVEHCLGIQAGEVVSIVTDSAGPDRLEIARVFWEEARAKGAEVILAEMLPRKNGLIRNATLYVDDELMLDKGTLVISPEPDSR